MKHIYIILLGCGAFGAAWTLGQRTGQMYCREQVAAKNQILQTQIIQKQGEINVETLHTGVADIRRVLRTQYTIAE